MKTFFSILILFIFVGCDQKKQDTPKENNLEEKRMALSKKLDLPNEQVILAAEAQEITNEWLAYITAQSEIENLKNYTLNNVIDNATPIAEIMKSLKETVPASLKSNAVQARLGVLVTKSKILQQLANKREVDPKEIATVAKELPLEWNNFKIQINELFLKTLEEFEEELDEFEDEMEKEAKSPVIPPLRKRPVNIKITDDSIE